MLCSLKVRRGEPTSGDAPCRLQVTAKHAVGGAGGVLSDEETYPAPADLFRALGSLGAPQEVTSAAISALQDENSGNRWLPIATDLQIPFDTLTNNGFHLEQRD